MDARFFTTAKDIQRGLNAIPARAVSRADGFLHLHVLAGHHWAQADGNGPADQDVAQVRPTELGAWLAERLQVCMCGSCHGAGRHEADEGHQLGVRLVRCEECAGEGSYLGVREEWLDSPVRANPPVFLWDADGAPETDGAA